MEIQPHYPMPFAPYVIPARRKDTALIVIAWIVIGLHALGIGWNMFSFSSPEKKIVRQQVIVKTVQLSQPKFEPVAMPQFEQTVAIVKPQPVQPVKQIPVPPVLPTPVIETPQRAIEVIPPQTIHPIEQIKPIESPAPKPVAPKKNETKKVDVKPKPVAPLPKAIKSEPAKPATAKKPINPAPVKKGEETSKPDKKAKEAEKAKEQALAAAAEAAKLKQQQIAIVEESARQKQQLLLADIHQNIAKNVETRDKISTPNAISLANTSIPQRIQRLEIDSLPMPGAAALSSQEIKYQDSLGARLKMDLILPDYGTVKVKLTLAKTGKVVKIEVTSPSDKNKRYIEKILPTLVFAPFGSQFDGADQHTFMLMLHNDE